MKEYQNISHGFGPVYNRESRILILGSFPSVKSREQAFFYGHPQNRFWKLLAGIFSENKPETIEEKREFLHKNASSLDFTDGKLPNIKIFESLSYRGGIGCTIFCLFVSSSIIIKYFPFL